MQHFMQSEEGKQLRIADRLLNITTEDLLFLMQNLQMCTLLDFYAFGSCSKMIVPIVLLLPLARREKPTFLIFPTVKE